MESIEKLREYGHDCCARIDDAIHDYCDEIEREISEKYMLLPVDCENKPIHIGDVMDEGKVAKLVISDDGEHSVYVYKLPNVQHEFYCYETAHKPRTIEDVLKAFFHDALDADAYCTVHIDDVIAKYADELRGMGVDDGSLPH